MVLPFVCVSLQSAIGGLCSVKRLKLLTSSKSRPVPTPIREGVSMNQQMITTPKGERMVVLPEAEYLRLLEALEDSEDRAAVRRFRDRLATGEEELLPSAMVDAILDGESRVRIWREHRGLTAAALAKKAGIASAYLSQIETGKREGTVETYRKLAAALGITLDDLIG